MTKQRVLAMPVDNSFMKKMISGVLLYMLGPLGLTILPLVVGGAVRDLGLNESQAGYLASIDLLGVVLTSVTSVFWIHRISWRKVALASIFLVVLGNVASMYATSFSSISASRFLAQLGSGGIYSLAILVLAQSAQPSRYFSLGISATISLSIVIFLWVPELSLQYGNQVLYGFHSIAALIVLPAILWLPTKGKAKKECVESVNQSNKKQDTYWLIAAFFLLFFVSACCGALWAYIGRIGDVAGFNATYVGEVLALTQVVSFITAIGASVASVRWGRLLPVSVGIVLFVLSMLLIQSPNPLIFMIGACASQVAWIFVLPYLMLLCVESDTRNHFYLLITAFKMGGFSAGPAIVAVLLNSGDLSMVSWVGLVFLGLALLVAFPVCRRLDRTAALKLNKGSNV